MLTTDFVFGSPCWLDLGAPDVDAAAAFYGAVFDWEHKSAGPDMGGYGFFQVGGRTVAAVGPLTEEGARSAWTLYFSTSDADSTVRSAERSGGKVRAEPMEVGEEGRLAQLSDPQGADFAIWQPGRIRGLDAVSQPGALSWTELCTSDVAGAKAFYGALFGWQTSDVPMPGGQEGTYTLITPSGQGEDLMQGGFVQLPDEYLPEGPYWHPVFDVADTDATVARITSSGGNVQMGPEDVEGVGRLAVGTDPSGAEFVVLKPGPR
ncbi:VOC family protein [Nocardiopsis sediminis]|uniref:VOC family protein n=1 Tax=Nocardiopsis sediminis TaxID=1778267 RepID=A0ABV8FRK0_9ACTN